MLKTGGCYLVISYAPPKNRVFHFERPHLSFDIQQFVLGIKIQTSQGIDKESLEGKTEKCFVYLCRKRLDADAAMEKLWARVEKNPSGVGGRGKSKKKRSTKRKAVEPLRQPDVEPDAEMEEEKKESV